MHFYLISVLGVVLMSTAQIQWKQIGVVKIKMKIIRENKSSQRDQQRRLGHLLEPRTAQIVILIKLKAEKASNTIPDKDKKKITNQSCKIHAHSML